MTDNPKETTMQTQTNAVDTARDRFAFHLTRWKAAWCPRDGRLYHEMRGAQMDYMTAWRAEDRALDNLLDKQPAATAEEAREMAVYKPLFDAAVKLLPPGRGEA